MMIIMSGTTEQPIYTADALTQESLRSGVGKQGIMEMAERVGFEPTSP